MKRKRFKKQSDFIKYAVKCTLARQSDTRKEQVGLLRTAGDFLQNCAAKLRLPE